MEKTIFSKTRTSKEGKKFYTYFTTLTKKTGEDVTVQVKFREECGQPDGKACPMNIEVAKEDCNYSEKTVQYETPEGETKEAVRRVLWISNWKEGTPYVDTSMDAFID